MPVALLLVEGQVEVAVLSALCSPPLAIETAGGKSSLKPKTRERRREKKITACYLRDRDFDFDPPADRSQPQVDSQDTPEGSVSSVLGYRWCRHEIENYLLEPRLIEQALGWRQTDYIPVLLSVARQLCFYTAARWALGIVRRNLPRLWALPTRPGELTNEIQLPADCSQQACFRWAHERVDEFKQMLEPILTLSSIGDSLQERAARLAGLTTADDVLAWHAGKDLLAALQASLPGPYKGHPKVFLRDSQRWVCEQPKAALAIHPEWQALRQALLAG